MKKIIRILLISLVLLLAVPVYAKADPPGYKIVKLTNKNIKKYFTVKPCDTYKIGTYGICLCSKLRKKGYFVYGSIGFKAKLTYTEKYKTSSRIYTVNHKHSLDYYNFEDMLLHIDDGYYKKCKIQNIKFSKVRGKVIFVQPSNIIGIEEEGYHNYTIKLQYPYDSNTWYQNRWVYNNGTSHWEFDYYGIFRYNDWFNDYLVY